MQSVSSNTQKAPTLKLPVKKRREYLARAVTDYAAKLDHVIPYLESRGIRRDTAERWQLGYVETPLPGHEDFVGRLAIPYLTPAGPLCIKFRCVESHDCKAAGCVKYLGEPNENRLFGVWNFRHTDDSVIHICEGELDAIVATQAGVRAVGVPGATQWRGYWDHLFEGYDEVVLIRDGDAAGRKMSETLMGRLPNLRTVKMPEGEDVSSFVLANGGAALIERITV
jgi:DNA primase